jgi:hypothetical protein
MQRKSMLAGLTVVLMLTALMAVSQCRAGLFDGLFRKDRNHWKKSQLERRPPCEGCTFSFHQTTWRPWGTCCETAQSACTSPPWSGDNREFPAPGPYDSFPTYTSPGPYDTLPNRAPVDNDYQFTAPRESDQLLIPDDPAGGQPAPSGVPVFQPFERVPLDPTNEEPVPTLTPPPGSSPALEGGAPSDLTSPDSLLLPESTRPAVPLPAPSTVPPAAGVGPQAGRQRSWQPISFSNWRDGRQPQARPQQTRKRSSEWRVMPGFYGPQQTTRPADRTMFVPPPRR